MAATSSAGSNVGDNVNGDESRVTLPVCQDEGVDVSCLTVMDLRVTTPHSKQVHQRDLPSIVVVRTKGLCGGDGRRQHLAAGSAPSPSRDDIRTWAITYMLDDAVEVT